MSVHYKFKSALEYDTVTFDGLHISVKDLKNAIIQQKRIGKSTDFDLQVTNAQTKEVYEDENALIPKNASLLIARIPIIPQKNKSWEGYGGDNTPPTKLDEGGPISKEVDLSNLDAPEDDKIRAMMSQSTQDYDPSNYMKIRGANQVGPVPVNYKCYKCHQGGHWIKDCTFGIGGDSGEIKKSTGIPRSFMVAVDGPQVPGAMMTPNGQFAVPLVDHQAYNHKPVPVPVQPPKMEIPEELVCNICSDLLTDAVMIPCCGNSFCDECIRGVLLESEDHECPDCHEKEISPDTLIPNRFLRTSVANFKNTTGYIKIPTYKESKLSLIIKNKQTIKEGTPPLYTDPKSGGEKQTVISEADSTEPFKTNQNPDVKIDQQYPEKERIEGPPGVSPKESPRDRKYRGDSPSRSPRERATRSRRRTRSRSRSVTPRRSPRRMRSRSLSASRSPGKRSGTPTVDEPVNIPGANNYPPATFGTANLGQVPIQGPPTIPASFPPIGTFPTQGPPPNYRFPPPVGGPPYMGPAPYTVPRGMFDGSRPPIGGPPSFQNFPPSSRSHRDYNRRMLDRAPTGVIDDPLAAFNRLLREKDEQKRRAKQRSFRRSYSRSRSRSRSFSRSPIRRRSRSPRAGRRSRSRSRSFSLSRSRSRSFSGSPHRQLSPARRSPTSSGPPRRGSRFRSPVRSPIRSRNRDRDYDDDRDYDRNRDSRRIRDRRSSRDRDRFYDNYDDKRGSRGQQGQWAQRNAVQDNYYPTPGPQSLQAGYQTNRFGPSFMNKESPFHQPLPQTIHSIQPQRQFQDIAPPGVEDDIAPPGVEEHIYKPEKKEVAKKEEKSDRRKESSDKKRGRHDKRSRTPEKIRSPKRKSRSKEREKDSPDKHRKRRRDSSDKEDDDKSKRSKDKKKHKDKKDSEKKKKRDKKDKHKKESKEKKTKDEFKQVIPKNRSDNEDEIIEKKKSEKERQKETKQVVKEKSLSPVKKSEEEHEELEEEINTTEEMENDNSNDPKGDQILEDAAVNENIPEQQTESKINLYEDATEIDNNVIENYGKLEYNSPFEGRDEGNKPAPEADAADLTEDGEIKEFEDEKDILELHSNDMDLKTELEKNDILAPVPEKSKWEVEDDGTVSPRDTNKSDSKSDKNGKVTSEVLKRAENAIFAKAINAIRNPDVKKPGPERIKKDINETTTVATVKSDIKPVRISVKDRLGIKVEDPEKVINLSRRSTTVSPFSRRGDAGRNITVGERRPDVNDYNKKTRRSRSGRRSRERTKSKNEATNYNRNDKADRNRRDKQKKDEKSRSEEEKKSRRKRSRSISEDKKEKHKKKDRRTKKDKAKKKEDEDTKMEEKDDTKQTPKRKGTIDEATFEPDYDESQSDMEDNEGKSKKKSKKNSDDSSSSDSESSSSSEEERKKKKRKKHRKKKKRETSSSSCSSSSDESDSSDSEKERKRKKNKKNKKKKRKSKYK